MQKSKYCETGAVISVGKIDAGVRSNVIPEELTMNGTIRTLNSQVQDMIHKSKRSSDRNRRVLGKS
jgi:metal-dependent amidase/aminoacylase/carboxypeptidase family protein